MLGRTDSRRRLLLVLLVFVVSGSGLVARLAWWQVVQQPMLVARAQGQTLTQVTVASRRGTIYDRSGTVVLATTVDRYMLEANPNLLSSNAATRTQLATDLIGVIGLAPVDAAAFNQKLNSNRPYVILAHNLDQATADRLTAMITADGADVGVDIATEAARVEPQVGGAPRTSLAAQMLGFVNRDGVGQYGIEQYYQDILAGRPKVVLAARSINGRPMIDTAEVVDPGTPGQDISLTIDDNLQLAVEQEVMAAAVADSAVSVSAVVIDPRTGQVYAEASYPSYDANNYAQTPSSQFVDPVISATYEPGSVFKMLTALAALQQGTITPTSIVNDSGSLSLDHCTARIFNSDKRPMGRITFRKVPGLLAQRRRRPGRPRPGLDHQPGGLMLGDLGQARDRPADRDRPGRRGEGYGPRPGDPAMAPGGPGQRCLWTGRRRHGDPAGDGLCGDGQRRHPGHAPRRGGDRQPAGCTDAGCPGHLAHDRRDPDQPDVVRRPHGSVVRRQDAGQGLRDRRQDRHGPDLGSAPEPRPWRLDAQPVQQHVRGLHRPACPGPGDRGRDPRGQAARDQAGRPAYWPSRSYELFRRIATDSMTRKNRSTSTRPGRGPRPVGDP